MCTVRAFCVGQARSQWGHWRCSPTGPAWAWACRAWSVAWGAARPPRCQTSASMPGLALVMIAFHSLGWLTTN
eukprot:12607026-Alexandrium_andersonii.AAC.1